MIPHLTWQGSEAMPAYNYVYIDKQGKQKKITVFKYRPKKKYRKKQGHRQPYTKLTVKKIIVK